MALPSDRQLWEAVSDTEWHERYHDVMTTRASAGRRGLTVGDLLLCIKFSATNGTGVGAGQGDIAEELGMWCDNADDLCMLLWLTVTMNGSR